MRIIWLLILMCTNAVHCDPSQNSQKLGDDEGGFATEELCRRAGEHILSSAPAAMRDKGAACIPVVRLTNG
jgi:hypothetical protein